MGSDAITNEVRALEGLDLEGLREEWRRRIGPPPAHRSAPLLRRLIAWRLQAAAYGDLDPQTRRTIVRQASGPPRLRLEPGVRLAREWQGVRHEVEVTADGFVYRGERYGSLSEVARTITGSRWNGLRFFGLRDAGSQSRS